MSPQVKELHPTVEYIVVLRYTFTVVEIRGVRYFEYIDPHDKTNKVRCEKLWARFVPSDARVRVYTPRTGKMHVGTSHMTGTHGAIFWFSGLTHVPMRDDRDKVLAVPREDDKAAAALWAADLDVGALVLIEEERLLSGLIAADLNTRRWSLQNQVDHT